MLSNWLNCRKIPSLSLYRWLAVLSISVVECSRCDCDLLLLGNFFELRDYKVLTNCVAAFAASIVSRSRVNLDVARLKLNISCLKLDTSSFSSETLIFRFWISYIIIRLVYILDLPKESFSNPFYWPEDWFRLNIYDYCVPVVDTIFVTSTVILCRSWSHMSRFNERKIEWYFSL